jgi:hypothetical protein
MRSKRFVGRACGYHQISLAPNDGGYLTATGRRSGPMTLCVERNESHRGAPRSVLVSYDNSTFLLGEEQGDTPSFRSVPRYRADKRKIRSAVLAGSARPCFRNNKRCRMHFLLLRICPRPVPPNLHRPSLPQPVDATQPGAGFRLSFAHIHPRMDHVRTTFHQDGEKSQLLLNFFWSGRRESDPRLLLGRQGHYHYATPANTGQGWI